MTNEQLDEALRREQQFPEVWWWLSFCDPRRPAGDQFIGVAVVKARGFVGAVRRAHELHINPGGETAGMAMLEGSEPPPLFREVLLSRNNLMALEALMQSMEAKRG